MYGKHFSSMYEGSMMGAGCHVFAVWGYIISRAVRSRVELNPKLIAVVLGCTEQDVVAALDYLSRPDANSRNKECEGRRIVRDGEYQWYLPSHDHYQRIRSEDDRREYNRIKQQEHRDRVKKHHDQSATTPTSTNPSTSAETQNEPDPVVSTISSPSDPHIGQ